jgi:hypothetical protein
MAVNATNVLVDGAGVRTVEGQTLMDFASAILDIIVDIFYTVAFFIKDFVVEHTMWFIFLLILGGLYGVIRRRMYRVGM